MASTKAHTWQKAANKQEVGSQVRGPAAQPPTCPECGSTRVWKDGLRKTENGPIQRFACRDCGYRFSEKRMTQGLNSRRVKHLNRQVCELEEGLKNLVKVESQKEVGQREATKTNEATIKGKIVEYAWWMKKQGYKPSTIKTRLSRIKRLHKLGANLLDPETVKEILAKQNWEEGTKNVAVVTYSSFLEMLGLTWKPPRYQIPKKIPFIPTEKEIDALINSCGKKMGCYLQGLKDTGADPGELARLEWTNINYQAKSVTLNHPVKGHNPRVLPISNAWLKRLGAMPKNGNRIFTSLIGLESNFRWQRRRIAERLGNPRLLKITFRTLRHWKGTMEYHKTKDILHVQRILGHKNIQNTMIYINLEAALFEAPNDNYTVRVAKTLNEACKLVEAGFEYVTEMEGAKLFRKQTCEGSIKTAKVYLDANRVEMSPATPSFLVFRVHYQVLIFQLTRPEEVGL